MATPVLHLLAGPNGAGKSTLFDLILGPATHLEFVNADMIAAQRWPGEELERAYDASAAAAARRTELMAQRASFVTETVFSHPSKVELLRAAVAAGYRTSLHIVAVPVELSVARVEIRHRLGGHDVPEQKIRERWSRLWAHLADAVDVVDEAHLYDNSTTPGYRQVIRWACGVQLGSPVWPPWLPEVIRAAGR